MLNIEKLEQVTVQLAVNGMFWIDNEGRIRHANRAACQMLKYDYEELTSKGVFDIDPAILSLKYLRKNYFDIIKKQGSYNFESSMLNKLGVEVPIEATVFHVYQGGQDYYCCFFLDISLRRQIQTEAEKSETLLRAIFNHHFQLTGLMDSQGKLLMANQTALDFIGLKEEEVLGQYFWDAPWFAHSKALQNKVKGYVKTAVEGEFVRVEYELSDNKGKQHIFDHSFKPVMDNNGDVQYVVPESRDITEIRRAEKKLQKAYKELEKLKNQLQDENLFLKEELRGSQQYTNLVGKSNAFKNVLIQIEQVAETNATVLILGETGTGKELVANNIHDLSNRREKPMVKVNCAAIPANLIESELFGHEKGAFTSAHTRKIGRFELADGGTIFLDEIGELPIDLQAKLLRVLQEGEFERIGGNKTFKADIRIIAATNRDLKKMIDENQFREDLYYRLHVFPVVIPPLRDRLDDVGILSEFLVRQIAKRIGKDISRISEKAMKKLQVYSWPGNVRELENVLERAMVLSRSSVLEIGNWFGESARSRVDDSSLVSLDEMNRRHISRVLTETKGRIRGEKGAAKILKIHPSTLESRMRKLNIKRREISG